MQNCFLVVLFVQVRVLLMLYRALDHNLIQLQFHSLALNYLLLNRVLGHKSVHVDLFSLSDSVASIHGLQVDLRIKV